MARKTRSAKHLGTRHDLNYFKQLSASRRWLLALSVALPLVGIGWLGVGGLRHEEAAYSSGPLSPAHAFFHNQCSLCHASLVNGVRMAGFKNNATDAACLSCHQAPAHHANQQLFTPSCSSCHVEHRGTVLAQVNDTHCSQCHSSLKSTSGQLRFVSEITGFNRRHPEFAPLREGFRDPGTIAFNHAAHLSNIIRGPNGRVQLECSDCHRPLGEPGGWKYGEPTAASSATQRPSGETPASRLGRELMAPVSYQKNCIACHSLQFDARFSEAAPHDKPAAVHAFLLEKFGDYIAHNPNALREKQISMARVPGISAMPLPQNAQQWVSFQVERSEKLLWGSKCKLCHQLDFHASSSAAGGVALPAIRPAMITQRWLPHSIFSHESHQAVECSSCHAAAPTSQKTSDVLIPGVATCQACHNGKPTEAQHAENGCFLCHAYHNWNEPAKVRGIYSIRQLTGKNLPAKPERADNNGPGQ